MWREGQNVVEVGTAFERIFEPNGLRGRAEVDQRSRSDVAPIRSRPRHAPQLLAVGLVAEEQVAALHLLAQITEAGGALDPAFVPHGIGAAGPRAEILVELPPPLRIDFEHPHSHSVSSVCSTPPRT